MMKRIGVLTSGGDAPGMNAAIRAVVRSGIYRGIEIYGIRHGYRGLIDGDISLMSTSDVGDIIHRGGTVIKTARCDEFKTEVGMKKAVKNIEKLNLDGIVAIGGDGTLKGAIDLEKKGIKVFFIPATIDNDMGYTQYSIGFDTAVNTVVGAINNIRETGMSHDKTTVIEVMGRHCGDIALRAGLAGGADCVLIPEREADISKVCNKIKQGIERKKKNNIIIRAEGALVSTEELTEKLKENIGEEIRTVILGYLQRGGSPTAFDRNIASVMGKRALDMALENKTIGTAIGYDGSKILSMPLSAALKIKKMTNKEFLDIINMLA